MRSIGNYLSISRSPFFSLLSILPILILYEAGMFLINRSDVEGIRNGADVLLRQFFALFNIYGFYASGLLAIVALILSGIYHYKRWRGTKIYFSYFATLILESLLYAFLLFFLLERLGDFYLSMPSQMGFTEMLALSLGAGVYEELLFRALLITGFIFFLKDILRWERAPSAVVSIILASLLFSFFHFIGRYGDNFSVNTFILRFAAGIYLSAVYYLRGFGAVAYTHALYDLLVLMLT